METQDSEQPGATLDALAIAATNAEGERDEVVAGGSSAGEKKKHSQYKPVTDEAELAALRSQGLTDKGESKVAKGDLRCRPPKLYSETFFDKKLPQFRLKTVVDTIRAEDIVMTWAHVTGRDKNLRTSEFRFDTKNYLDDEALISDLKALGNSSDAMVAYLKARFGTIREPGVEPSTAPTTTTTATATATATIYQGSLVNSNQPAPAAVPPHLQQQIKQEDAPAEYVLPIKTAREYVKEFKNSLLKKMHIMARKQGKSTEIALTAKEEKECEVRALHKAAWDGQAIAAFDLATRIGNFNAVLNFNYTPLHQVVLGSVKAKRRTNLLTAERLIKTGDSGAHVNAQDVFGRTPLHHASRRGDLDMMDLLIAKGAEVNAVSANGSTPLHCAAESGGVDAVQKLLAAGAEETSPLARTLSLEFPTRQNSLRAFSDAGSLGLVRQTSIISNAASGSSAASFEWEAVAVNVQQCGTALHWAARAGQDLVVQLLIKAGYNVNAKDWHGTTPLQAAAREYKDVFPDRLEVGDYRNYIKNYRMKKHLTPPPSERDKSSDYMAVIRYLQCVGSLDKEAVDADGRTALHVAAACGNLKCVKLLLTGAPDGTDISVQKDKLGFDPLMLSVIKSEPESVLCFMDQSSTESEEMWKNSVDHLLDERNVDDGKDLRGRTALHLAVLGGIPAVVSHLITRNAQVDALDNNGTTPLLLAARTQQLDCVQALLSKGADPNIVDDLGCSSLSAASLVGDLGIVELLLKNKADVNLTNRSKSEQVGDKRKKGRTALHDAAEAGHVQIVECLIKHGADVNLVSEYGQTPLHVAARYGNTDVVQTLIRAGSGINAVDNKGRTALQIAQYHGLMDVVELLKQETQKLHGSIPAEVSRLVGEAEQRAAEQQQQPSEDVLEVVEYRDWKSRFNLLNAFVKDYGRIPAPDEWFKGYPLGSWVELQKEKIRWDEMAEDEVEAIGAVGLTLKDWGAGVPWMDWLQSIKEFVAANDKLPSAVAPKEPEEKRNRKASGPTPTREVDEKLLDLGWWCKFQQCRRAGKENGKEKSSLNKNQIKELEALRQWRWELPKDRKIQRRNLCLRLHLFCMKYKRFPRPDEHYLGVPLGKWCEVIRKLKLWGDLPKERQEAIQRCVLNKDKTEIFPGSARDLWNKYRPSDNDYLDSLEVFIREQKRHPTHADAGSHSLNVGIWLNNQKQKWKNGKLAADVQRRIEEIFKSNSVPFRWLVDRNSAGGAGDVEMEVAAAVAVATVPPEKKVSKVKAEEEEDVDAALDLDGNSSIAKKIRSWKAKTSESIELKTAELVEYFRVCRKYKLEVVAQLPSKPAAGSAFFLQRGSKYKQDGYSYKKESNTKLKANGVNVLHGSYITTEDETLQRRMYWELDYPDLIFVQYLAKKGSPSKRKASSQSQQAVKEPLATGLDTLCEAAETEAPSPAPKTKKRAFESLSEDSSSSSDDDIDDSSGEDSLNDNTKRRKRWYQGEEKNLLGKAMEEDSSSSDDERVPKRRRHSRMKGAEQRRKEMDKAEAEEKKAEKEAKKKAEEKEARTKALVLACKDGDEAAVKKLISEGVNYDYRTSEGDWALVRACENGHEGIVELLLDAGVSLWGPMLWSGRDTADFLLSMCDKGHTAILKMLCAAGNVNLSDEKGKTALMYACENGLEVLVKLLLEVGRKIDVNLSDENGKTALMYASIHGSKPIVELLLKAGAEINVKDNNRWTALVYAGFNGNHDIGTMLEGDAEGDRAIADKVAADRTMVDKFILACGDGDEAAVQKLISEGVDVDATNAAGETGLMQACREKGHAGVVKLLLDAKSSVNLRCKYEKTALMHACLDHRRDIVELLLDAGVEIDVNCKDSRGVTALMYACNNGDDSIVERLCSARADIHIKNNEGETALMYACRNGSKAIVEYLLKAGADVNLGNKNDETALMFACYDEYKAVVELLINSGAEINAGNRVGKTALMFACQHDSQAVVKLLLAHGAKIDKKTTNDGNTAFMFACQDNSEAAAEVLLKSGADVNYKNIRGWTALMLAGNHKSMVQFLLKHGAAADVKNSYGRTALMYACENGWKAIVELLLDAGADVNLGNMNGETALMYAQKNCHTDILKMLEEVIASKEQKNPAADAAAAATPSLLKPPADTDMEDAEQKKGSQATIGLPSQVIEMIASTPVDNYVAVSSAFRSLYDHGVGGQAMRWAALQIVGKKLEDDQKVVLFQGVKDYIAQGKLKEAVDWVNDFQADLG